MNILISLVGRDYHLTEEMPPRLALPDGADVAAAIEEISSRFGEGESLPPSCLVALNGRHLGAVSSCKSQSLNDGDELMLIAPVAGG